MSLRPVQLTGGCRPGTEDWQFSLLGVAARMLYCLAGVRVTFALRGYNAKPLRILLNYITQRLRRSQLCESSTYQQPLRLLRRKGIHNSVDV